MGKTGNGPGSTGAGGIFNTSHGSLEVIKAAGMGHLFNFTPQVASIVPEAKECGAKLVFGGPRGCRFEREADWMKAVELGLVWRFWMIKKPRILNKGHTDYDELADLRLEGRLKCKIGEETREI